MKTIIAFCMTILLILVASVGCDNSQERNLNPSSEVTESPNAYLPQIMIDGVIRYLKGEQPLSDDISESEYLGEITSIVPLTQIPTLNEQANFDVEIGAPYAKYGEGIAVMWNGKWMLFVTEDNLLTSAPSLPAGFPVCAPENAPQLDILLASDNTALQPVRAVQLTTSWMFVDDNGDVKGYEADSPHTLQLSPNEMTAATLYLEDTSNTMVLLFSDDFPPESISVLRWEKEYARSEQDASIQNIDEALRNSTPVEVSGNTISVDDYGHDYIYEVHAVWTNGNSYYAFRTDSVG
jgi:hypothetical protein